MDGQLIIPHEHAYCYEVQSSDLSSEKGTNDPVLRVYRNSPETIHFQVRTYAPINGYGRNGKRRNMIAGVSLDAEELRTLRNKIDELIDELTARSV